MSQKKGYSQLRALFAISKASLISTMRSPSAVVFSFGFPLFFILVFGFIGNNNVSVGVAITQGSDTTNAIFAALKQRPEIKILKDTSYTDKVLLKNLEKGNIGAILEIKHSATLTGLPYQVTLKTSKAAAQSAFITQMFMMHIIDQANLGGAQAKPAIAELHSIDVADRAYKSIDFILPGMLGFSLLSTGVFGTAFVFLNLRNTLVIKRFFATPVQRSYIVLGEALSRVVFALITSSVIIILGHFAFGFTLVHGFITFLTMLLLSFIGLFVFMGFGFIVSGLAKNESAVPPLANIITLPQFLLAGTFFSTSAFPYWLQPITKILPLTYLNEAMRKVAFEGSSLVDVWFDLMVLGIWGVVVYFFATKLFKWE